MPSSAESVHTGARGRTRRAILAAAASVWSRDFGASLAEIAERAEVSRSTLHRYFAERQDLIDELLLDSQMVLESAYEGACVEGDQAIETLEGLLRSLVEKGDRILFLFSDPHRFEGNPQWADEGDASLVTLIEQAQSEGSLDTSVDPGWVQEVYYSLVYVAAEAINRGSASVHQAGDLAVRTFLHGLDSR